jgi:hypothetical protein
VELQRELATPENIMKDREKDLAMQYNLEPPVNQPYTQLASTHTFYSGVGLYTRACKVTFRRRDLNKKIIRFHE